MGLLDDAIREHLELRRRHGADPSEVMSKEQEALGPATTRAVGTLPADAGGGALFAAEPSAIDRDMTAEDRRRERRGRREPNRASADPYLGQETVELDMRAVLGEDASDASVGVGHAARGGMRSMTSAAPVRALR
jgi:hypothetical protein